MATQEIEGPGDTKLLLGEVLGLIDTAQDLLSIHHMHLVEFTKEAEPPTETMLVLSEMQPELRGVYNVLNTHLSDCVKSSIRKENKDGATWQGSSE